MSITLSIFNPDCLVSEHLITEREGPKHVVNPTETNIQDLNTSGVDDPLPAGWSAKGKTTMTPS